MTLPRAIISRPAVLQALFFTAVLMLMPFIPSPMCFLVTGAVAVVTAAALRGTHRAAARLGLFVTLYLTTILLGSAYSQVSFGSAILLYLLALWRVPRLQGDQPWMRWGHRGIVLDTLRDVGLPLAGVIGLQAAAFGTIHIAGFPRGWIGVGLATVYGTLLGVIRMQAGGMLAPWVAHILTDIVIVTVVLGLA